jgi:glycosyltransferase involved in cell wall biosynthesis
LLEAAAMAKPLITTDVPGCREVVIHGENGHLVPPRSAQSLADAMTLLTQLPEATRLAMGARSRQLVEQRFDERIVVQRYCEALAPNCPLTAAK